MNDPRRPGNAKRAAWPRVSTSADTSEPASPHRAGHYVGLHPEDAPRTTTADVQQHLAPRQAYPSQKLTPRSAYRYKPIDDLDTMIARGDAIEMDDGVMFRQGNDQVYAHRGPAPVPLRSRRTTTAQYALPPPRQQQPPQPETEPQPLLTVRRPRMKLHWLFFVGLACGS